MKEVTRRFAGDNTKGPDAGGFFPAFSLIICGVLLAYLITGGNKKKRVKSAWIGFGVSAFILLLFMVTTAGFA